MIDNLIEEMSTPRTVFYALPGQPVPESPVTAKAKQDKLESPPAKQDKPTKQQQEKAAKPPKEKNAKPAAAEPATPKTVKQSPAPSATSVDSDGLPATTLLYQKDTYLFSSVATVLGVSALPNEAGWSIVLDETCFHAQGGGQPADTGTITSADGGTPFAVSMVKKDPAGVVRHDGTGDAPSFKVGSKVKLVVDESSRLKNARVHSAGHLIDVAMSAAGCTLRPTKGYHFTPGAYVEYEGKLDAAEREALVPKLQMHMDSLISKALPTNVQTVDATKLGDHCSANAIPSDPALWGTGWVRVVCVGGMACPCGGTHIADTKELGGVKVEKISSKGKVTRISYSVTDQAALNAAARVHEEEVD